jgi:NAD(P)-dependent dehydrogenase (short-subunit alcohol dehydrogenase family)
VGITADVARMSDLSNLYTEISKRYDRLDIVFANAGTVDVASFQASTEEHFDNIFNTNVRGFLHRAKGAPLLRDGASIILTSSVANFRGSEGLNVYSASKAAVRSFARSWTSGLRQRRIRAAIVLHPPDPGRRYETNLAPGGVSAVRGATRGGGILRKGMCRTSLAHE